VLRLVEHPVVEPAKHRRALGEGVGAGKLAVPPAPA
jgi:hypothetical protein